MDISPRLFCNPVEHIEFSGGNYFKHFWFGLKATCLAGIAFVTGLIHIVFPFLFPFVADEICIKLGKMCQEHRMKEAQRRETLSQPNVPSLV